MQLLQYADFWEQYRELGGTQTKDFASTNPATGKAPTPTRGNAPPSESWSCGGRVCFGDSSRSDQLAKGPCSRPRG
jgi:hypothetical protein